MRTFLVLLALFPCLIYAENTGAILQATLTAVPTPPKGDNPVENTEKIQPGSPMKVIAHVKNSGTEPNVSGKLFLRFMFPEPLEKQPNSLLFESEKLNVPSIAPGQEVAIPFNISQNWPSLFDFIRYDWGMRQYQAVFVVDSEEKVIGTLAVVFSAYYYEGPSNEIAMEVPTKKARSRRKGAALSQAKRHTPTHHRQLKRPEKS